MLREGVPPVVGDQPARVDEPELPAGVVFAETALLHKVLDELLGDADAGAAGAEEDGALGGGGDLGRAAGVDEAAEDDGAGALDVVVEHGVGVLVAVEGGEGVLEVFVLDDDAIPNSSVIFFPPIYKESRWSWFTHPGHLSVKAAINSSRNSFSSSAVTFSLLLPM